MKGQTIDFKLTVPLVKSDRTDGWFIRGVAAGIEPDKENDEFLPQAIRFLADQINGGGVPLRNHHKSNDILEDLGALVKADIDEDYRLWVEAELDQDNPEAQYLWKKVNDGKQYGLSVKGQSVGYYHDVSKKSGKRVRMHPMVLIEETSVTTRPVYTPSLGTVIRKAIDEDESSTATEEEEMTQTANGENTQTVESSAPENDTQTETLSPSDQLVKSLLANPDFVTLIKSSVAEVAKPVETPSDSTEVEQPTQDIAQIVKSAVESVGASFEEKLQAVLDRIPATADPAVLEKSDEENVKDAIANLDSRTLLRLGLAAQRGELDRVR